jgi:hypothetical protein
MPKPKLPDDVVLAHTIGLRLTRDEIERLDALVRRLPIASRHSIARACFRAGLDILEADPARVIANGRQGPRTRLSRKIRGK